MDASSTSGRKKTRPPQLHLEVRWAGRRVARKGLLTLVRAVLAGEGRPGASVGLRLTGDADLREMNRAWRGLDRPTDVLAFPADPAPGEEAPGGEDYLGDIALSMERAAAQAPRFGATLEAEAGRLVIHGLLHLLGYDHHTPADGRRMRARERLHLESIAAGSILPPC